MDLFASPGKLDPKLKILLDEASSLLCKWVSNASESKPIPKLIHKLDVEPSIKGISREELMAGLHQIMNDSYNPSCPGALAHLDPPSLTASIVGDMISAGLNNNLLANELSPSLSLLERNLCEWFARKIGMPSSAGGVAASGGSISNLMALVLARNKLGLSFDTKIAIIASEDAHVSITRALKIMGLPIESFYKVNTNSKGEMDIKDIKENLMRIKSNGLKCFAIVATAGTTFSGSIDPLNQISEICNLHNIWLHIDASIGGVFALSRATKKLVEGLYLANSLTINPQKVLGIAKTSSLLLVSNFSDLYHTFATGFPYIDSSTDGFVQGGEIGIQGSRPAEILKLWLGFRQMGLNGISSILENAIERKRYFLENINKDSFVLKTGPLHIVSMSPQNIPKEYIESWKIKTKKILLENEFMLSSPIHNKKYFLKAVFGNPHTSKIHLDKLISILNVSTENY